MPRLTRPIDTTKFEPVMAEALVAFAVDVDYACAMVQRARVILSRRAGWDARRAVRAAESQARTECAAAGTFSCGSTAPCGVTTACRFSTGELRDLVIEPGPMRNGHTTVRPQPSPDGSPGSYNLETAVQAYRARLEASSGTA